MYWCGIWNWTIKALRDPPTLFNIDCEQSLSKLGRTGESEMVERETPFQLLFFTFARFARFPRSRDHSEGLPAVYIQLTWDQVYFRFAFKITFRRARRNEQVSLKWLKVTIYPQTENITLISLISINFIRKITLRIVHILESLETPHMLFITLKH